MILSRRIKLTLLTLALLSGLSGFHWVFESLGSESITRKDFIQEYLMARAIMSGVNPYLLLPELNDRFQTGAQWVFSHPTPHTPVLAIFSLPLAFLKYAQAAGAWLSAQILCLLASVFLLIRQFIPSIKLRWAIGIAWAAMGWSHVWEDLVLGQINLILLLLIVGAWLSLRNNKPLSGGALLGLAVSIKLIFWPLVLLLVFVRRWRSPVVAIAVFIAANLIAASVLGRQVVTDYFVHVGPSTAALYKTCGQNLSLWSVGWRVFTGTGSPALIGVEAPPLFFSMQLARITSFLLTGAALILGLATSVKVAREGKAGAVANFDFAYGMMICVCLLVSPLTWPHYLILTAIPIALIFHGLRQHRFPRRETLLFTIAAIFLLIPSVSLDGFISYFSLHSGALIQEKDVQNTMGTQVPFAAGLLSLIPSLSVMIFPWLMRKLSRTPVESQLMNP